MRNCCCSWVGSPPRPPIALHPSAVASTRQSPLYNCVTMILFYHFRDASILHNTLGANGKRQRVVTLLQILGEGDILQIIQSWASPPSEGCSSLASLESRWYCCYHRQPSNSFPTTFAPHALASATICSCIGHISASIPSSSSPSRTTNLPNPPTTTIIYAPHHRNRYFS